MLRVLLTVAVMVGSVKAALPTTNPATTEPWRSQEWWLDRAAGEAKAATDPLIRQAALNDIALFRGPADNPTAFRASAAATIEKLSKVQEAWERLQLVVTYGQLLACLGAKDQAARALALAERTLAESGLANSPMAAPVIALRARALGPAAAVDSATAIRDPMARVSAYISLVPVLARIPGRVDYDRCGRLCLAVLDGLGDRTTAGFS